MLGRAATTEPVQHLKSEFDTVRSAPGAAQVVREVHPTGSPPAIATAAPSPGQAASRTCAPSALQIQTKMRLQTKVLSSS
jgi:hypothetical protein